MNMGKHFVRLDMICSMKHRDVARMHTDVHDQVQPRSWAQVEVNCRTIVPKVYLNLDTVPSLPRKRLAVALRQA